LIGIPWRVAFALQAAGWYLRQDIIWHKPNPLPESVTDRCTKAHEYLFLLAKSERYYFDADAISEPLARPEERDRKVPAKFGGALKHVEAGKQSRLHSGNEYLAQKERRNRRSVWTIATEPYSGAHFAVFPAALVEPCILSGSRRGDVVLDPFMGSGTTAQVAQKLGRNWIGCEINRSYEPLQRARTAQAALLLA
jgi:DNA modification methylase